jgi:mannonate dehydratase
MKIADLLPLYPDRLWTLAKQVGVTHAVSRLPLHENGDTSYEFSDLLALKERFESFGFKLEVIEPGINSQMHNMKLGIDGRDQDIEDCIKMIRNMGALNIPIFCYNFMAQFNWVRTSVNTPTRGGAIVTSYNHSLIQDEPITEAGIVTEDKLWDNLKYFLERVIPVAEASNVKLALHPDDPPISPIKGVSRIITNVSALLKAIDLVPSNASGVTFCQGTLSTAGENIPEVIERLGRLNKIFFVHFRDVRGTAENFTETFHDDGQTDMFEAMKTYKKVGYDGPVRIDHVPTMVGENNTDPGYGQDGRLFAWGYLKGLMEGAGF